MRFKGFYSKGLKRIKTGLYSCEKKNPVNQSPRIQLPQRLLIFYVGLAWIWWFNFCLSNLYYVSTLLPIVPLRYDFYTSSTIPIKFFIIRNEILLTSKVQTYSWVRWKWAVLSYFAFRSVVKSWRFKNDDKRRYTTSMLMGIIKESFTYSINQSKSYEV